MKREENQHENAVLPMNFRATSGNPIQNLQNSESYAIIDI